MVYELTEKSFAFVFHADQSVALFLCHRKADCDAADCETNLLTGAEAERACANSGSLLSFGANHCYLGDDFETARQYAMRGVEIWRSGGVHAQAEEIVSPVLNCLVYEALSEWYLGEIASSQASMAEAISLAKELNDMSSLAFALYFGGILARFERNPAEVERLASELTELSTRYNFAFWLPGANVLRGWARSVCGDTAEGISWIEQGIEDYRATGSTFQCG